MRRSTFVIGALIGGSVGALLLWAHTGHVPLSTSVRADSVVVEKSAHRLLLFENGRVQKSYRVSLARGGLAPKRREGDLLVPEGRYMIDSRLERSGFHRALHVSYPDSADAARARRTGVKPGHSIMVHGIKNGLGWLGRLHRAADWTAGCVAVTNREIEELWSAVPNGTPIVIRP
jgi:murein L,D-transpeptidase YafK